jgi:hypothetical protein
MNASQAKGRARRVHLNDQGFQCLGMFFGRHIRNALWLRASSAASTARPATSGLARVVVDSLP